MSAFQWKVYFDSGLQPRSGSYGLFILVQAFHNVANICLLNVLPLLAMLLAVRREVKWALIVSLVLLLAYAAYKYLIILGKFLRVYRSGHIKTESWSNADGTFTVSHALNLGDYISLFNTALGTLAVFVSLYAAAGIFAMLRTRKRL